MSDKLYDRMKHDEILREHAARYARMTPEEKARQASERDAKARMHCQGSRLKGPNKFVEALLNRDLTAAAELLSVTEINSGFSASGWTALHYVCEEIVLDSAEWLLNNGADPNRKDNSGWTPLHLAVDSEADQAQDKFVREGFTTPKFALTKLLLRHGADPNILSDDGQSPLSIAKRYGYSQAIGLPLI